MKKPKMIFKVNRNNLAKIYVGKKWHKRAMMVDIHAEPMDYTISVTSFKANKNGVAYVENNEVAKETKVYKIGRRK